MPTSAPDSFTTDTASRSLPGGALKSRRMPFPDSPVAVDALRSSEARATAGVYGQRLHDGRVFKENARNSRCSRCAPQAGM